MKNIISISTFLILFSIGLNAQITLTYENHSLVPDYTHKTQYVENVSPGSSGENQIWDFTNFACNKLKTTEIYNASETKDNNKFPMANIAVLDDNNYFYFKIDEFSNEYYGLITSNAVITFEKPIIKMVYPFTYGDKVEGDFFGEGLYYGELISNVSGTYEVSSDAYGTLLLPNNVSVENVLRVKSVNHIFETACETTEIINEKYLWYSADSRLPIMVVIINTKITGNNTTVTNNGYYNENAFQTHLEQANSDLLEYSLNIYPNPFVDIVNISYNIEKEADVSVEIFNSLGQKIETLVKNEKQIGFKSINYNVNKKAFAVGNYFVKIIIDDKIITKKIIMID
jgi:hypothetical protein